MYHLQGEKIVITLWHYEDHCYILKKRGRRTDPWGIRHWKRCVSESESIVTNCFLISYSITCTFKKKYVRIYSIKCFLQVNKDSTNKHSIIYCLFNNSNDAKYWMCSRNFFFWNPNCFLYRTFSSFKSLINFLCISFSTILSRFDNREICL